MFLLRGAFVETPNLGEIRIHNNYLLVVNDHGIIIHFDQTNSEASARHIASAIRSGGVHVTEIPNGSFILPTFCDLHLHAPQFLYQGNGLDLTLFEWLDKYTYKAEERLDSDPVLAKRVYSRLAKRLLENGTGAVSLFGTIDGRSNEILAQCMLDAGIRARIGKLSMDISTRPTYVEESAQSSLDAVKSFVAECHLSFSPTLLPGQKPLVEPILTPRFVPTCSDELLNGLSALSGEQSLHIQSHLAEGREQVEWVKSTRKKDDIDMFDDAGLLTSRTLQAHCTYLAPPDLQRLTQTGTSVAHCPLSNVYFSVKPFPLREALSLGVKVGLGTDVAGGYSMDIMNAMRNAVAVSRLRESQREEHEGSTEADRPSLAITWVESLYLATRGGAIGLGGSWGTLGGFGIGCPFDAQQIQLLDEDGYGVGSLDFFDLELERQELVDSEITEEMVEKWWCIGDNRNRAKVWVQGSDRTAIVQSRDFRGVV